MTGQTVILGSASSRDLACRVVRAAPHGAVLNIRQAKRTNDQNALMWVLLSEISRAKPDGRMATPEVWKGLFMHSLGHQCRFEVDLDGNGMVPLGFRTSQLSKAQMGDLLDVIYEFAARKGIALSERTPEPTREAA